MVGIERDFVLLETAERVKENRRSAEGD